MTPIPKGLFVQFEGVSFLVRPKVEYIHRQAREMPVLASYDGFHQLYTDSIIPIYQQLRTGKEDGYSSLSERQPLVQAGKLSKDAMAGILSSFADEALDKYDIWAELGPDWQPEKRMAGYTLPSGMNVVLYRNWSLYIAKKSRLYGGFSYTFQYEFSKADIIPMKWIALSYGRLWAIGKAKHNENENVFKEMIRGLGLPEDTDIWADKEEAILHYGLNALLWSLRTSPVVLGQRTMAPFLRSNYSPYDELDRGGAFLGYSGSVEEMVENFSPSKIDEPFLTARMSIADILDRTP